MSGYGSRRIGLPVSSLSRWRAASTLRGASSAGSLLPCARYSLFRCSTCGTTAIWSFDWAGMARRGKFRGLPPSSPDAPVSLDPGSRISVASLHFVAHAHPFRRRGQLPMDGRALRRRRVRAWTVRRVPAPSLPADRTANRCRIGSILVRAAGLVHRRHSRDPAPGSGHGNSGARRRAMCGVPAGVRTATDSLLRGGLHRASVPALRRHGGVEWHESALVVPRTLVWTGVLGEARGVDPSHRFRVG